MVLANVAAAQALEQRHMPCLYRVHDQPDAAKIEGAARVPGHARASPCRPASACGPPTSTACCSQVDDKPVARLVNETMLRSQSQAVYSPDNLGHFGLALARYAHFTSPIRRFPDLIVHRALISAYGLGEGGLPDADKGRFAEFGEHLSMCERRAVAAERSAPWTAMSRPTWPTMSARPSPAGSPRVTRFGLFVALDGTGADGLIPIRSPRPGVLPPRRRPPDAGRRADRRDLRPGRPPAAETGRGRHRHRRPAVRHRRRDRAGRAPCAAARPAPCDAAHRVVRSRIAEHSKDKRSRRRR